MPSSNGRSGMQGCSGVLQMPAMQEHNTRYQAKGDRKVSTPLKGETTHDNMLAAERRKPP
jgi:hypothetical protein